MHAKEFSKQYIAASGNQVYFTWQGGEPTLAGLDFFRKVIHYQQRYACQKRIFNALLTNGILLNNEWCAFLKEHEFLVGISIDGPQELHDRYRRSNSGNGTFAKVIAAIERLKSYQMQPKFEFLMQYKRMAFNCIMIGVPFSKNLSFRLVSRSMAPKNYMTVTDAVIQVTVLLQK